MKILIVDDSALFRNKLIDILSSFEDVEIVGQARNGFEAGDKILVEKPDLITMDISMAGENGMVALGKIKKDFPDIKIFMLTNFAYKQLEEQAAKLGADAFFDKSGDIDKLLDRIKIEFLKDSV